MQRKNTLSTADRQLKAALEEVYAVYGPNLAAYFRDLRLNQVKRKKRSNASRPKGQTERGSRNLPVPTESR